MKNTKKNHQSGKISPSTRRAFRALPIIAALVASGVIQPAFAVDRTWFGGTGDFGVATNWTSNGVPGSADRAIINSGNSTLSFNTGINGLDFFGGIFSGTGNLAVSGLSTWTSGTITGAATTTFDSTLDMSGNGSKVISGGRTVNADDTNWSGNTGNFGNNFIVNGGTFNNIGTFTDTNAFANQIISSSNGFFNNSGTYNKQTDTVTTIGSGVAFNNTGTVNVNAGTLRLNGTATHSGTFALVEGSTLDFNSGTHNLNSATINGAGTFQISGGTVNLNGGSNTALFLFSGGILTGTTTPIGGAAT